MSRDELIVVVRRQAGQITAQAVQIAELMEANEALAARLARLEHLLSRNSGNSSNPPSCDDEPGKPAPPEKRQRGRDGPKRARGKQPGAPGRIWRGPMTLMIAATGSPKAAATAVMIWPAPGAPGSWTPYHNTRTPRAPVPTPKPNRT